MALDTSNWTEEDWAAYEAYVAEQQGVSFERDPFYSKETIERARAAASGASSASEAVSRMRSMKSHDTKIKSEEYVEKEKIEELTGKRYRGLKDEIPLWQAKAILRGEGFEVKEEGDKLTVSKVEKREVITKSQVEKALAAKYGIDFSQPTFRKEIKRSFGVTKEEYSPEEFEKILTKADIKFKKTEEGKYLIDIERKIKGEPIKPEHYGIEEKALEAVLKQTNKIRAVELPEGIVTIKPLFEGVKYALADLIEFGAKLTYVSEQELKRPKETFNILRNEWKDIGAEVGLTIAATAEHAVKTAYKRPLYAAGYLMGMLIVPTPNFAKTKAYGELSVSKILKNTELEQKATAKLIGMKRGSPRKIETKTFKTGDDPLNIVIKKIHKDSAKASDIEIEAKSALSERKLKISKEGIALKEKEQLIGGEKTSIALQNADKAARASIYKAGESRAAIIKKVTEKEFSAKGIIAGEIKPAEPAEIRIKTERAELKKIEAKDVKLREPEDINQKVLRKLNEDKEWLKKYVDEVYGKPETELLTKEEEETNFAETIFANLEREAAKVEMRFREGHGLAANVKPTMDFDFRADIDREIDKEIRLGEGRKFNISPRGKFDFFDENIPIFKNDTVTTTIPDSIEKAIEKVALEEIKKTVTDLDFKFDFDIDLLERKKKFKPKTKPYLEFEEDFTRGLEAFRLYDIENLFATPEEVLRKVI